MLPSHPQLLANADQGQPAGIQLLGLIDLSGGQGTIASRHARSFHELGHRLPVDPELLAIFLGDSKGSGELIQ